MTISSPALEHIFEKTKTICFGRLLIDVPVSAEVVYGPTEVLLPIERHSNEAKQLEQIIATKLAEIEKQRHLAYGPLREKNSMLGKIIDGAVANQKIIFGISPGGGDDYRIESYLPVGDDLFVQKVNHYGESKIYEKVIQTMNSVSKLLRARNELEIPTEPGLCIDGGFIPDSKGMEFENFRLGIRLAEFPDVQLSIASIKKDYLVVSDAIEPRLRQAEEEARREGHGIWYSRVKFLRRGNRTIEKWSGYEVLARKPAQATELESHEFAFLSQGEPKNPYLPVLDIKLHTGIMDNKMGGVKASITDDEAVALWDKLTKTIRVRPAAATAAEHRISKKIEVGALVLAGRACPRSGWWECADGTGHVHVSGGARQHFNEGVRMPQAVLLEANSVWNKLKGGQKAYATENATLWTLVKIDDAGVRIEEN